MDGLTTDRELIKGSRRANRQAGITLIETMFAAVILIVGSLSMVGLIVRSIANNNRNKLDSTQMMLASSIAEQINSTIIGTGSSSLTDCNGATHTIDTDALVGGANLSGDNIDFSENIAADSTKNNYHMDYVLRTPCTSTGALQGTYDVRWRVAIVQDIASTNTYVLTIGARLKNHGEGNLFFSKPVSVRVMSGN
jgi:type II secretory pathway pseudopilin PulG